ncbi:hypothetical protein [Actinocorallia libanotica]|uniref:DUF559 domain-containing protein n=1 Tax=Actinocorallia libanotica TaxID=46162 RepID=A0ABN1R5L4_9ACTN
MPLIQAWPVTPWPTPAQNWSPRATHRTAGVREPGGQAGRAAQSRARSSSHKRRERSLTPAAADPGERVDAELKNWRILRKIRSGPDNADELIAAVQALVIASA